MPAKRDRPQGTFRDILVDAVRPVTSAGYESDRPRGLRAEFDGKTNRFQSNGSVGTADLILAVESWNR